MSQSEEVTLTDHAVLVAWGQYAHCLGLIEAIQAIRLDQKTVEHSPQSKVSDPPDKDLAVAQAWGQVGWADYSGVSRTLVQLSEADVQQIVRALERVSQPLLDREVVTCFLKCI